ncbi:hypothetical protein SCYAM73S_05474 [Streptomyces cyaneofuscatus]
MPTPYGSRGGMAFSADELRVLRRALAIALHPMPLSDEDVQDCLRLAGSVDEAVGEAGRLRAFLLADLARYRAALPGSVTGYLELLQDALAARPRPPPGRSGGPARPAREAARGGPPGALPDPRRALRTCPARRPLRRLVAPGPRSRLLALPGGRAADREPDRPKAPAAPVPGRSPAPGSRPAPKPSEVFPPRRRPTPPPSEEERAAGSPGRIAPPDAASSRRHGRAPRPVVRGSLLWTAWTTYPRSFPPR